MKPKPAVLAALIAIAVIVSGESAVVVNHFAHRAGSLSARACVVGGVATTAAKTLAHVVVRWAKS